ncbi:DNA-dependent ATPase protein rad54 [Cladochytrium tenue]|nr:DNA-dependent ATPase protein rad54 [Cladochytrium tenue]
MHRRVLVAASPVPTVSPSSAAGSVPSSAASANGCGRRVDDDMDDLDAFEDAPARRPNKRPAPRAVPDNDDDDFANSASPGASTSASTSDCPVSEPAANDSAAESDLSEVEIFSTDDDSDDEDFGDGNGSLPPPKRAKITPAPKKAAAPATRRVFSRRLVGSPSLLIKPFKNKFVQIPNLMESKSRIVVARPGTQLGMRVWSAGMTGPLHNPEDPDAFVLYSPPKDELDDMPSISSLVAKKDGKKKKVHVVVDPILAKVLRPHQVEGVRFMYDCVTGSVSDTCFGCIMADEMAIVVCPATLVGNWKNELEKWLRGAVRPFVCDNKGTKEQTTADIERFTVNKGRSIVNTGHRLKNKNSLTYESLNELNVKRRVILTGTPIQNDLSAEFYNLISFAIPSLLGTEAEFRKNFENHILRGRDADASDKDLPEKHEHVVFCRLSEAQLELYRHFQETPELKRLLSGADSQPLKAITLLKKLCNHPNLIADTAVSSAFPTGMIQKAQNDKIVLISNYTQTLDLFENMCRANRWPCVRLDGSMPILKRKKVVDRFNAPDSDDFVFLLSSKAGGCGINLIGANRLVLFDPDWNPANDAQALARVWRDGQKKVCFLYRFIATGSIEEKIFQRQAHKQSLSSCVVDEEQDVERHFSLGDLRKLFLLNPATQCDTHDTFKCKRCFLGRQQVKPPEGAAAGAGATDTSNWNHFSKDDINKVPDGVLKTASAQTPGAVSFVFHTKTSVIEHQSTSVKRSKVFADESVPEE